MYEAPPPSLFSLLINIFSLSHSFFLRRWNHIFSINSLTFLIPSNDTYNHFVSSVLLVYVVSPSFSPRPGWVFSSKHLSCHLAIVTALSATFIFWCPLPSNSSFRVREGRTASRLWRSMSTPTRTIYFMTPHSMTLLIEPRPPTFGVSPNTVARDLSDMLFKIRMS